jgi:glutamate-1-semialdehyde 2,1-aminomutase
MQRDGWWWHDLAASNRTIRRAVLKEIIAHRLSSLRGARQK